MSYYGHNMYDQYPSDEDRSMFQDPYGNSALRRSSRSNPRNLPCPQCGQPNRLTPTDRRHGYVCNPCANHNEGTGPNGLGEY